MSTDTAPLLLQYLGRYKANDLKSIARRWMGQEALKLRKADLLDALPTALRDPSRQQVVAAGLTPRESAVLGILKQQDGRASLETVRLELRLAGIQTAYEHDLYRDPLNTLIEGLASVGLLVILNTFEITSLQGYGAPVLVADPLLLRLVAPTAPVPIKVPTLDEGSVIWQIARRPNAVVLDTIAVLETVKGEGSLPITQAGHIRTNVLRRIHKTLGWHEKLPDGLGMLHNPVGFWVGLLSATKLLQMAGAGFEVAPDMTEAVQRPAELLIKRLIESYASITGWMETKPEGYGYNIDQTMPGARRLLVQGLRALPNQGLAFVSSVDFSRALFELVGDGFSLGYPQPFHAPFKTAASEVAAARSAWLRDREKAWDKRERLWLEAALRGPMVALGLVQIGSTDQVPLAFRLTDLGRRVLLETRAAAGRLTLVNPNASAELPNAWVVQPNFEIVVFLEHATPAQLAFIERHAERQASQTHTATYRLTAEALYTALEWGSELAEVLTVLESGAGVALPQNVRVELTQWAARREQITIYPAATVLEFPNAADRERALAAGLQGHPTGDTFVLVAPELTAELLAPWVRRSVAYNAPPVRCLQVDEDGTLTLIPALTDLLVEAQTNRYAEQRAASIGRRWKLTKASVSSALAAGTSLEQIIHWLQARAVKEVPPLLLLALRGWTGQAPALALGEVILLQCPDQATCQALATSAMLSPFLHGLMAPTLLLVEAAALDTLRETLDSLGLMPSAPFTSTPPTQSAPQRVEVVPQPPAKRPAKRYFPW